MSAEAWEDPEEVALRPKHSFYEYIDAVRLGNLPRFEEVAVATQGVWSPSLDRGAGAALHFAADHGQLGMAEYLVEELGVDVNQQDSAQGWTPLHRAARVAHYPGDGLQVFAYLLRQGADASIRTFEGCFDPSQSKTVPSLSVLDVAVERGRGWEPGKVRDILAALIAARGDLQKLEETGVPA